MPETEIATALGAIEAGEFRPGPELEVAHHICQRHEGDPPFDWIHALVHRIEGDTSNADYWYRRAGRPRHPGPVAEEWQAIADALGIR